MSRRRKKHRTAAQKHDDRILSGIYCDPAIAAEILTASRDLYRASSRLRRAGLPSEALAIVSTLEALTIQFGQWLSDNDLTERGMS